MKLRRKKIIEKNLSFQPLAWLGIRIILFESCFGITQLTWLIQNKLHKFIKNSKIKINNKKNLNSTH